MNRSSSKIIGAALIVFTLGAGAALAQGTVAQQDACGRVSHGKIMIADDKRAIVGSINLSPGSFDDRRELAIETSSNHVVKRLLRTAEHDWKRSRKLPLSDQAVQADLEGHGVKDLSRLALDPGDSAGLQYQ